MPVNLARSLAEALLEVRREAGLTQVQMAKRLGLSQPTLNRLESGGQNTTLKTLAQLCRALACEPGDLFVAGRLRTRRPRRR
ncbi:MAG: helix-turn-helix transcriptional regulator [Actinobacteria bacterium]|nr:MAG: helix-turn-helix transcriptional regulator [Actinomycetota bacterium]